MNALAFAKKTGLRPQERSRFLESELINQISFAIWNGTIFSSSHLSFVEIWV